VFVLWLWLVARLPLRWSIRFHKLIGRAIGALMARRRAVVVRNIQICFPELTRAEAERLAGRHFENVGAFIAETGMAWFGRLRPEATFRIEGVEHLEAALAERRGVVLFSGHFTTLEICTAAIKRLAPLFAFVFRARGNALLNEIQRRGRVKTAHVALANDDVRATLRLLEQNATVWFAPDQARIDSGALLPFFGEPAMTSTATTRLARVSGAVVVPLFFCRRPDDASYVIRFHAPLEGFPTRDADGDTLRLIAMLEGFVRECPEQYFWMHRRFKDRPGMPDAYAR
jgi:KDO2-lipid IV(A) lauroyltransferase